MEQAANGKMSKSAAFDDKTAMLIQLAAALAIGSESCIKVRTHAALKLGVGAQALIALVKLVRLEMVSSVLADAEPLLEILNGDAAAAERRPLATALA